MLSLFHRPGTCVGTHVLSTGICEDFIAGTTDCPTGFEKCASLFKTYFPADTTTWKLLWRGTRDGFAASEFHNRCDYQGTTITVVKSESGYIFGGVTGVAWASRGGALNVRSGVDTTKAFLFGIRTYSRQDTSTIFKPTWNTQQAMNDAPKWGPSFAGLSIAGDANANANSVAMPGDTYTGNGVDSRLHPPNEYFAGTKHFKVAEIEVFKLV